VKASAWKAVILTGAIVCASLFVSAFQLVWIRSDISEDAKRIAELEYLILKAQDELRALEVTVEDAVQPDVLQARIGDRLRLPHEGQVIRVRMRELESGDAGEQIAASALIDGKEGV
jgi:hypothetical protein